MDRTQGVLLTIAGVLLVVTVLLVLPFLEFVLLTVLLAYPLQPLQQRLETRTDRQVAAASLVVATTLVVVVPLFLILWTTAREVTTVLGRIRRGDVAFTGVESYVHEHTGLELDLTEPIRTFLREANVSTVDGVLGLFGTVTHLLVGLALSVFLLYYLLKDGRNFGCWLRATVPLPDHVQDALHEKFDDVMRAVLASHLLIAVIQGLVAGVGLVLVDVPNPAVWTVVMIILAILPIIGSFLVWGPAALYLFSVGQPLSGSFLFVYGTIVVGLTDDYLRPIVIDRYTQTTFNPGVILLGVLGGVYLLGFLGVFFGPIIVGLLRAVLDVYRREYVEGEVESA